MTKGGAWAAWRERIRRYERSGLTVTRFCEQEGVSAPSFYQWRKRFAAHPAPDRRPAQRDQQAPISQQPAFRQLTLAPGGGVMSIELAGGARMELPAENLPLVRAVVAELLQAERGRSQGEA
jgi:transposase-like protein